MIKVSALLVALAIGLLVAGVVGSSLLMVYVSIGVCAVAALLLAAGVLAHWSEIFGRREARSASTPGAWSEPQVNVTAPVLASIQAVAAARSSGLSGREEAGARPDGERPGAVRPGAGRPDDRPAEVVPSLAEVAGAGDEAAAPRRGEDLWERVEEELGSAAKRDTGALSWPGTVFPPVPPDGPAPAEPAAPGPGARPQGEPHVGTNAWIWGSGAGWQPSETADPAWPPPAAALAEPKAAPESAAPVPAAAEPAAAEPAGPEDTARTSVPDATAAEPAAGADVAKDTGVAEDAGTAPGDEVPGDTDVAEAAEAASGDGAAPDDGSAPDDGAALDDSAAPDDDAASRPAGDEPAAESPAEAAGAEALGADDPGTDDPHTDDQAAGETTAQESAAQEPAAEEPAAGAPGAPGPAAGEPAGDGAAAQPAPARVEVTVVPGVARYHRSECILIRFLGAGDLEIMTRQEAEEAKMMACRACQPDQLED